MKFYRCFDLRAEGCPRHIFEKVREMAPGELSHLENIEIEASVGDDTKAELIEQILAFLKTTELPRSYGGYQPGTYGFEITRMYEPVDLTGAMFLKLTRHNLIQLEEERDEQGRLLMAASKAQASRKIGRIDPNWIIVSEAAKKIMVSGKLVGLEFGEVVLKGKSVNAAKEPFWELKSSLTLPKMANTNRFVSVGHVPFDGDYSKTVWIDDPPYRTGEIHYRESDLEMLGSFDIAQTLEKYMEPHPALVVSQRFYQHCLKHKIPLEVEPVRIDQG